MNFLRGEEVKSIDDRSLRKLPNYLQEGFSVEGQLPARQWLHCYILNSLNRSGGNPSEQVLGLGLGLSEVPVW